ncbi:aldo/keto reductase [Alicyclobacillus fodiniaquatilis]|uniref:Aldo/keto reductase n=1 Tax=Alicyclobacillus fodiniaquatilis TaxID=1661150 RepID=A0ABW4JBX1_9BACL
MVATHIADYTVLNNGMKMPWFGLGVWQGEPKDGPEVEHSIRIAIEAGYRHIDTAAGYENEVGVGNAVRASSIPREEIFITSKVRNSDQGYDSTLRAFEESFQKLGLDYIDLYLIHWPVKGKYKDTWRALEQVYRDGRVKAIGVSNFQIHHLEDLLANANVVPTVNQIELHPLLTQVKVRDYCRSKGIQVEAWSPLMQGHLDHPVLTNLAVKYKRTVAQLVLRWDLQHEIVTIPKSAREVRIRENADVFNFELSDDDMAAIDSLNQDKRFGADPDNFDF